MYPTNETTDFGGLAFGQLASARILPADRKITLTPCQKRFKHTVNLSRTPDSEY